MSDKKRVFDMSVHRKMLKEDPILQLADKLCKFVAKQDGYGLAPEDQLVALDLASRALMEAVKHAKGEAFLNEVIVAATTKSRRYDINWPEHDQSKTLYDNAEPPEDASVVPLRKEKHDEGSD